MGSTPTRGSNAYVAAREQARARLVHRRSRVRDMTDKEWERYTSNPDAATLGLWSRLSDAQRKAALAYDGPESHGRSDLPAIKR